MRTSQQLNVKSILVGLALLIALPFLLAGESPTEPTSTAPLPEETTAQQSETAPLQEADTTPQSLADDSAPITSIGELELLLFPSRHSQCHLINCNQFDNPWCDYRCIGQQCCGATVLIPGSYCPKICL